MSVRSIRTALGVSGLALLTACNAASAPNDAVTMQTSIENAVNEPDYSSPSAKDATVNKSRLD